MGRFGKWLGKFKLTVSGERLELKPTLGDKERLMALQSRAAKKKDVTENEAIEIQKAQNRVFKDILRKSYAIEDFTDEEIDGFLLHNDLEFMQELYIAWGWLKRKDLENIRGEFKKKALKGLNEV